MTKLYKVMQGKLETVDLLDPHNICDGATVETYLVKGKDGRRATCSKDFYHTTAEEALESYKQELLSAIMNEEMQISKSRKDIDEWKKECEMVQSCLKDIRG